MLDERLLEQYAELLGNEGLLEMYETFSDNIRGYVDTLNWLLAQRDEVETRRQAHKLKGACRSVGLRQLARTMESVEREAWTWEQVEPQIKEWVAELPIHQAQLRRWLSARGIE
ncbi:Hpt domain-containing protein [Pseudidiomarina aestuarii]|uniref:Hpt domain-containing protein n=1 Tax=Pseudidiomarina aestuarii TaxID=624146 RepID=UPI003A96A503